MKTVLLCMNRVDLHAIDATSAQWRTRLLLAPSTTRNVFNYLLLLQKTGERSWSWSSEFRREAVRRRGVQQQKYYREALGYPNVRAINKQPRVQRQGSACQQTCQSTQSSFLHLWLR